MKNLLYIPRDVSDKSDLDTVTQIIYSYYVDVLNFSRYPITTPPKSLLELSRVFLDTQNFNKQNEKLFKNFLVTPSTKYYAKLHENYVVGAFPRVSIHSALLGEPTELTSPTDRFSLLKLRVHVKRKSI